MRLEIDIELSLGVFRLRCDCRIEAGTLGVFGPSGAGKTTLLHVLAGLLRPSRGRIALDNNVLFDQAGGVFVPAHRRHIGVVFQDNRLFPHLSVRGNLKFAQKLASARWAGWHGLGVPPGRGAPLRGGAEFRVGGPLPAHESSAGCRCHIDLDSIVGMLELDALLDRKVSTLSGGECQRVALGRALLSAPRLLLLDEPVSAVDAGRKSHLLPMLRRAAQRLDLPVIVVSHELHQLLYLTDRLFLMEGGRCIAHGGFPTLLHDPDALRLLHPGGIVNLLRLRVSQHRSAEGMTLCSLGEARDQSVDGEPTRLIRGPLAKCPAGGELTATLRPEDVILSLAPAEYISAQNQLVGHVKSIVQHGDRTLCCVDIGTDLFVDVTYCSAAGLELTPGKRIWCLFKAHAVKYLFEGGQEYESDPLGPAVSQASESVARR